MRDIKVPEGGTLTGIEMRSKISKIPDEVLREIFPEKLRRREIPEELYTLLKKMILSGKLKKGQKLTHEGISSDFNVNRSLVQKVISQLKEDGLIISKGRKGSFVV